MRASLLGSACLLATACRAPVLPSRPASAAVSAAPADSLTLVGSQFLAVSVADLEASRRWYQAAFALRPILDETSPDSSVRTVVLASPVLVVELSAHRTARALQVYAGRPTPTFLVHGFFKGGVVVANLDRATSVLRARGVTGVSQIREDTASALRFAFARDPDGNFLQLLERDWRPDHD